MLQIDFELQELIQIEIALRDRAEQLQKLEPVPIYSESFSDRLLNLHTVKEAWNKVSSFITSLNDNIKLQEGRTSYE